MTSQPALAMPPGGLWGGALKINYERGAVSEKKVGGGRDGHEGSSVNRGKGEDIRLPAGAGEGDHCPASKGGKGTKMSKRENRR